jgi:fructose-bisphosphate aldolase, class I
MMDIDVLRATAGQLVAPGRGILAADESTGTIKKRFDSIELESTEDNRRAYRDMLFTTPGLGEHISGVILFDETIRQSASDGTAFPELLAELGVVPGIKVDTGAKPLASFPGETVTEGLDGLRERLAEYRELGARFAKWRATVFIGEALPTDFAILANAHAMARFAALCQEAGIVPVVEPEILMDGDHSIEDCEAATARTLSTLYAQLADHRVDLAGSLLKVNMVLSGADATTQAGPAEVAEATLRVLRSHVPADVGGVVFLSGGQSDVDSTVHLNEMNRSAPHPWPLSFSYGRALQAPSIKAWGGDPANVEAGQRALAHRARMNGLAQTGSYSEEAESSAA